MSRPESSAETERVRGLMGLSSGDGDLEEAYAAAKAAAARDPECGYLYALFLYTGTGAPIDKDAARAWLERSKAYRPAAIVLEEMSRIPPEEEDRLVGLRFRAERGDAAACRELFPIYDTGKDGDGRRAHVLKDHAEAVRLYTPCAEAGDTEAENAIGYMYVMGKGIQKDLDKAVRYLTDAYEHGCAQAAHRLAVMYDTGQCNVDPNLDAAAMWYRRAADIGYADAQYALAGILFMEGTKYYSPAEGRGYLEQAAEKGQPEAMHQYGLMHCYGSNGFRRDADKGRRYLEKACEAGVQQAQVDYANMCFEGHVLPRNMALAAKWFTVAAEGLSGIAQYALGCMYGSGLHFERDDAQAARWFEEAAEGGEPNAQYALGCFYYEGRGVERDDGMAKAWFQESANQGHPGARCFIAMFMIAGCGTDQDVESGVRALEELVKQGHAEAQYYLGKIYWEGRYVRQDASYARRMLDLAAKQGDPDAADLLEEIKRSKKCSRVDAG